MLHSYFRQAWSPDSRVGLQVSIDFINDHPDTPNINVAVGLLASLGGVVSQAVAGGEKWREDEGLLDGLKEACDKIVGWVDSLRGGNLEDL